MIQAAPRAELLWQPASRAVARIMGLRNVLQGTVLKATPDRIQFRWRGQMLEAVNSPDALVPARAGQPARLLHPAGVRAADPQGPRRAGLRASHEPHDRDDRAARSTSAPPGRSTSGSTSPGAPAQGDYDLEVEVPRLVYEILEIERDRHWQLLACIAARSTSCRPHDAAAGRRRCTACRSSRAGADRPRRPRARRWTRARSSRSSARTARASPPCSA